MKSLYEEALADVKQMKALAEANASKKIIEAVTPRIKQLIESELLRESAEDEEEEEELVQGVELDVDAAPQPAPAQPGSAPPVADLMTDEFTGDVPVVEPECCVEEPVTQEQPVVVLSLDDIGDDEEIELSLESIQSKPVKVNIAELTKSLVEATNRLVSAKNCNQNTLNKLISRVEDTYVYVQRSVAQNHKASLEEQLESAYKKLNGLQEQKMSRKQNKFMNEEDVTLKLTGLPDDIDLDTIGVDLITGSDEGEEVEASEEEEPSEEVAGDEGAQDEDVLDFGDEEGGTEEEEVAAEGLEGLKDDDVVEIDEAVLRSEIARMRKVREAKNNSEKGNGAGVVKGMKKAPKALDEAEEVAADELDLEAACAEEVAATEEVPELEEEFEITEPGVEETEEVLATEAKLRSNIRARLATLQTEATSKNVEKAQMAKRSIARAKRALAESVKRTQKVQNESAKNSSSKQRSSETEILRSKLAETNLANAKLAYTNKLLQNESLNSRQKKQIVETLESVKTVSEAKTVYESLTKALAKKSMNEGKVIGSASRVSRPAMTTTTTTLNEGIECDRWARLAGIK
jgi:hypothetical protein